MESESPDRLFTIQKLWLGDRFDPGYGLWPRLHVRRRRFSWSDLSPVRLASHLALLLVALLVLGLTRVQWPAWELSWQLPTPVSQSPSTETGVSIPARGGRAVEGSLMRAAVPITEIPERPREEIVHYIVRPGDTLTSIAQKFGISVDTVKWANGLELNPDLLRVGQDLIILPVSGVYHVVEEGETLTEIARRYKVKPEDIVNYKPNGLKSIDDPLPADKVLIIPGGEKPWVPPRVSIYSGPIPEASRKGTGRFVWPVTGHITSLFGQLVQGKPHRGLDIGAWMGAPVVASDSGYVAFAGWDRTGYGNLVIINHGNGFVTYYGHMSKIFVKRGQSVAQGQRIGSVGCTGNCTGPHLHFEIRYRNVFRNPIGFLP